MMLFELIEVAVANVAFLFFCFDTAFSTKKDAPAANTTAAKPAAGKVSGSVS